MKYTDAFAELQVIVNQIEKGEITIDELSDKVKRAAELLEICRKVLTDTENDVNSVLASIADNTGNKWKIRLN